MPLTSFMTKIKVVFIPGPVMLNLRVASWAKSPLNLIDVTFVAAIEKSSPVPWP